jgi:hypothetical protein
MSLTFPLATKVSSGQFVDNRAIIEFELQKIKEVS